MPKNIGTLVQDIYGLFESGREVASDHIDDFAAVLAKIVHNRMNEEQGLGRLRPSNLGQPCDRKLWYTCNEPEKAEPLNSQTKFKFLYGDIIEALVLFLAKCAGHDVRGEQDSVEIDGIKGSRDAVIDGMLVDVKSANSRSYQKFSQNTVRQDDPFGYITQLQFYLHASDDVDVKHEAAFLAVDKELGKMCVAKQPREEIDFNALLSAKRRMLAGKIPQRGFDDEPDGKSGNRKLGVSCRYCPFKQSCWPDARTFMYSNGPRWLTKVVRVPDVMEITDARHSS